MVERRNAALALELIFGCQSMHLCNALLIVVALPHAKLMRALHFKVYIEVASCQLEQFF